MDNIEDGLIGDKERDEQGIPAQLAQISAQRNLLTAKEGALLEKGLTSLNPDVILKAQSHWNDIQKREATGVKSTVMDPNEFNDSMGYKHKKNSLTFNTLRKMSHSPIIRAIITTRQAQVSAFSAPQANRFDTGFVIRKRRDYYDQGVVEISDEEMKEARRITDFVLNCGEGHAKWHGDSFDSFLKKVVEDSLSLDQGCFEVVRNRKGDPTEYMAVDGATMRIAQTYDDDDYTDSEKEEQFGYLPSYVQIIEGKPHVDYYPWELCMGIRNASTDIHRNGYGRSELEDLINIVTWMLFGDAYNGKFFSQGAAPRGLIKVAGNVNRSQLESFKQQWMSMVSGVQNAWKVPVIESDKMEFIDLQKSNTDMQFGKWQEYLIKVACAMYKIAPEEAGFNLGNASGGSPMMESSNEARIKYSRDKGLKPLLKNIEYWMNRFVINALNEDYEFAFVGMDSETREKELELDIKMAESFGGYQEARVKWGLSKEMEKGDFSLNSVFMQTKQAEAMAGEMGDNGDFVDGEDEEAQYEDTWDSLDKGEVSGNPMENDLAQWWKDEMK